MTTWGQLRDHIASNYKIEEESERDLKLIFAVDEGRTQIVWVNNYQLMDGTEDWVQIESPIGRIVDVSYDSLMREISDLVCGGVGAEGEYVTYRHALPMENLDHNEFARPLELVLYTADRLEKKLVGGDEF